jgi:hypothetical protein
VAPELIEHRIVTYRPKGVVTPEQWAPIERDVRAATRRFAPDSLSAVYLTMRAVTMFHLWAIEQHLPLDIEHLFTQENVERFSETGMTHLGLHSQASYRSALRRIGRTITKKAAWTPEPKPRGRATLADPYRRTDLAWLWEICLTQSSAVRRRAAVATMGLCHGAGLAGAEFSVLHGSSIEVIDGVAVVHIPGAHARDVPVLPQYTDELVRLSLAYWDRPMFSDRTPARNWTSNVLAPLEFPIGAPRLVPSRLRTTWMVELSTAGVRISELQHLAGVKTLHGWEDFSKFVPRRDDAALRRLIGGAL